MGILSWLIFGVIAGLVGRAIMPGTNAMGFVGTTLLGIVGSFLGGLVASAIYRYPFGEFHPAGFVGAVIGALVVLLVAGGTLTRPRTAT